MWCRKKSIFLSVSSVCALGAAAQSIPNAGSIVREIELPKLSVPAASVALPQNSAFGLPDPVSTVPTPIAITNLRITGNTLFTTDTLQALVASVASGNHTLGELQVAAGRITALYRAAGYFLARAYLPAQKMTDGVVTIAVVEGNLGEVQVQNTSKLSDETIKARLAGLLPGTVLQRTEVDRALLLLGDVPGVGSVDSRLAAGNKTGETVLIAVVKPAPVWLGKLEADNFGSLYAGAYRMGVALEGNSALGYGERLFANLLVSNENMVYGRAAVQAPFGAHGLTAGLGLTHSQYFLGDTYKTLDAVGQSDALEANVRYPLLRSTPANVYVQASLEKRRLRDEVRSTSTQTDKNATVASVALQSDWRDGLGGVGANNQASITLTGGRLNINSAAAAAIDAIAANTAGDFSKLGISISRQQGVTDKLSLSAQLRGQWADKNLDSFEKFSLGGVNGVRAYPAGEGSGDAGWLGSVELRYAFMPSVAASMFYDRGAVRINAKPYLLTANDKQIGGGGIGLAGNYAALDWRVTLAWRNGDAATAEPDKKPRLWAQAGWRF